MKELTKRIGKQHEKCILFSHTRRWMILDRRMCRCVHKVEFQPRPIEGLEEKKVAEKDTKRTEGV